MKNILVALGLTFCVVVASRLLFAYDLRGIMVVAIYLLFYGLLQWLQSSTKTNSADSFPNDAPPDRSHWPISGPLRKLGRAGGVLFMIPFSVTNLMSVINPFQLAQIIRQNMGNDRLNEREKRTGNHGADYQSKAKYRLPFEGEWLVFNGGRTPKTSHSWEILGQRFALDFVQADADFRRHAGRGTRLADYYCYGQAILAAADGTVVAVDNRISEAPFVGWGFCDFLARSFIGNHVVIQHAQGEYAVYAHLVKGSVSVQPGAMVTQGQVIGRCGHSGHSSEPHLHFHLLDSPDFYNAMGLPIKFHGIEIDHQYAAWGCVSAGQRVRNLPGEADQSSELSAEPEKSRRNCSDDEVG